MMGDFLTRGGAQLSFYEPLAPVALSLPLVDTSIGGGTARVKIADNNKALPQDRFYFTYNHFNNAANIVPGSQIGGPSRRLSFNRFTVGIEKVFHCAHSVEVRVPFTASLEHSSPGFGIQAEDSDNLTIIYKYLVDVRGMADTGAAVIGFGVNVPSGDDTVGYVDAHDFRIENEAVHWLPYVGFMGADENAFFQLFMQLDFAANGNPVIALPNGLPTTQLGKFDGQSLFYVDMSFGWWLLEDCPPMHCSALPGLRSLAGIIEAHYATALGDSDRVTGPVERYIFDLRNVSNRFDILNVTAGFDARFGERINLGVGVSLPLRTADNRSFDAQLIGRVNYRF